jgi:hypothetical protein
MARGAIPTVETVAAAGTQPEADRDDLRRPLPFYYDLYTFRGPARSTAVVAAFAVPAGKLDLESVDDGVRYRFDVSLVLADTARGSVSRTDDSVFVGFPSSPKGEHLLYTHVELQAPPSSSTVHRVLMFDATKPGTGQLYDKSFPIPDYGGSSLMLSDIALGVPGAKSGWRRGGVTLALLPASQFPASSFEVFYEVYNLPAETPYETEILVERLDAGRRSQDAEERPIRLRFSGEAAAQADGSVPELRRVDATLERGRYRITVYVTNASTGETADRARVFEVSGWDPGSTLVPALSVRAKPSRR